MADDFKVAAINWLLGQGRCDWMGMSTAWALRDLAARGVDYDASEEPDFSGHTMVDDGDTFTEATYREGISARIVPLGKRDWRDTFFFVIETSEYGERPGLTMADSLVEIVEVGEKTGESGWRERAAHMNRVWA